MKFPFWLAFERRWTLRRMLWGTAWIFRFCWTFIVHIKYNQWEEDIRIHLFKQTAFSWPPCFAQMREYMNICSSETRHRWTSPGNLPAHPYIHISDACAHALVDLYHWLPKCFCFCFDMYALLLSILFWQSKLQDMYRVFPACNFHPLKGSVELGDMCLICNSRIPKDARKLLGKTRQSHRPFSGGDLCHEIHHLLDCWPVALLYVLAWIILTIYRLILSWSSKERRKEGGEGKEREGKGRQREGRTEGRKEGRGRKGKEGKRPTSNKNQIEFKPALNKP